MEKLDSSFMSSIEVFDKCLKSNKLTDEERTYAEAMKSIFIKIEEATIIFNKNMNRLTGNDSELN